MVNICRWLLVAPILYAGLMAAYWLRDVTNHDYVLYMIACAIGGFFPVYAASKMAPSSKMAITLIGALVVVVLHIIVFVLLLLNLESEPLDLSLLAQIVGLAAVSLAGSLSAIWLVRKEPWSPERRDLHWICGVTPAMVLTLLVYFYSVGKFLT